jgi:hypothetical protein
MSTPCCIGVPAYRICSFCVSCCVIACMSLFSSYLVPYCPNPAPSLSVCVCSEYAADHLLQAQHHHNSDLLTAAAASQPDHILSLQQQLLSGANMHLDMLTYGNISRSEAADLAGRLQQLLPAQGLVNPGVWPPLGRVYSLSPLALSARATDSLAAATAAAHQELPASHTVSMQSMPSKQCGETGAAAAAAAAVEEEEGASGSSAGSSGPGPVVVTYLPDNPNRSNTNNAVYYCVQVRGQPRAVCTLLKDIPHATENLWHNQRIHGRRSWGSGLAGGKGVLSARWRRTLRCTRGKKHSMVSSPSQPTRPLHACIPVCLTTPFIALSVPCAALPFAAPPQLGPDSVPSAVLCELFAQMSSKPAFHELRTRQRLGYSVHLSSTR